MPTASGRRRHVASGHCLKLGMGRRPLNVRASLDEPGGASSRVTHVLIDGAVMA